MASDEQEPIPRPRFDHDEWVDRGYYLISEFQDEKRRRDRVEAVQTARDYPEYVCLMTPDHRLLHRNRFGRLELEKFRTLQNLVSTWSTPRYYVMGYAIEVKDLLRGIECYEQMGQTCNPLIDKEKAPVPSYFGCPRASVSLKYMHPKVWYEVFYEPDPEDEKRYLKKEWGDPTDVPANEEELEAMDDVGTVDAVREVSRKYCGCPLINLRRTRALYDKLPDELVVGDGDWRIAPDMMGQDSLQPVGKDRYYELLQELELERLPCSDVPEPEVGDDDEDEEDETPESRRERLKKFTWLFDE